MERHEANLIGGEWRPAVAGEWIEVTNPADTASVVARVPDMTSADIDALFVAAAQGLAHWKTVPGPDRASRLMKAASLLRERSEAIASDLVDEMGKTMSEARGEIERSADFFDYFSAFGRLPAGDILPDRRAHLTFTRREPVGIVLAVTPWNDPLLTPARKLAPALIAGNAVILKSASETPLVALHLARALHDAGLPAGAIGTATGRGSVIGPLLLADRRLNAVTFTGSTETGRAVRAELLAHNVRIQNEMGGKNAAVVLADADLEKAVSTIAAAAFGQAGQRCTATSRVLVQRPIAEALIDRLVSNCARLSLGPGRDPASRVGPLVSRSQQQTVLDGIATARAQGARLRCGGGAPEGVLASGCYVEPTIFDQVTSDMQIWNEELFGPVLAVQTIETLEEAILQANASAYGLSAAVFTRDLAAAHRFLADVDAGQIAVNLSTSGWDVHIPFGGFKDSGSPFKEQGLEAVDFYTRVKTVSIDAGGVSA